MKARSGAPPRGRSGLSAASARPRADSRPGLVAWEAVRRAMRDRRAISRSSGSTRET